MAHQALIEDGDIRLEDLPEKFRPVVEIVGMAAALALVRAYSGDVVYVPTSESVSKAARDRTILRQYKAGMSYQRLARRYGLSVSYVRSILSEKRVSRGVDIIENQLPLF